MEIGMIFYDTKTKCLGETLFLDGKIMVGKYYKPDKTTSKLDFTGYGEVVDNNKIWGKKHIIDYITKEFNFDEKQLEESDLTKEEISKLITDKIEFLSNKNKDLLKEIDNMVKHQELCYTNNRKKQINCNLKAIKRNNKRIKSLSNSVDMIDKKVINLQNKIFLKKKLISLVKGL